MRCTSFRSSRLIALLWLPAGAARFPAPADLIGFGFRPRRRWSKAAQAALGGLSLLAFGHAEATTIITTATETFSNVLPLGGPPVFGFIPVSPFDPNTGTLLNTNVSFGTTYTFNGSSSTLFAPFGVQTVNNLNAIYTLTSYNLPTIRSPISQTVTCGNLLGCSGSFSSVISNTQTTVTSNSLASSFPPGNGGTIPYQLTSTLLPSNWTLSGTQTVSGIVEVTRTIDNSSAPPPPQTALPLKSPTFVANAEAVSNVLEKLSDALSLASILVDPLNRGKQIATFLFTKTLGFIFETQSVAFNAGGKVAITVLDIKDLLNDAGGQLAGIVPFNPLALQLRAGASALAIGALAADALAADPPSSDFQTVASPFAGSITLPPSLQQPETPVFNRILADASDLARFAEAAMKANERYEGAAAANDPTSVVLQQGAFNQFLRDALNSALLLNNDLSGLKAILPSLGVPDVPGADPLVAAAIEFALTQPLSSDLTALLTEAGLDPAIFNALLANVISGLDPNLLNESLSSEIVSSQAALGTFSATIASVDEPSPAYILLPALLVLFITQHFRLRKWTPQDKDSISLLPDNAALNDNPETYNSWLRDGRRVDAFGTTTDNCRVLDRIWIRIFTSNSAVYSTLCRHSLPH